MFSKYRFLNFVLFLIIGTFSSIAQIGIGTQTPNLSAILDITSQKQGVLTPRMTTVQREAIQNPANGLLVFDTTRNAFEYFSTASNSWDELDSKIRDNFVLVKSQADFPAPSGGTIILDENTLYEINGTVSLSNSINLNGAYISGMDASEDVLSFPGGTIFKGIGGSIRNVTLTGGKAFEIDGGSMSTGGSFLLQNTAISNLTTSVGTVTRVGLVFANVVQFINNNNGIVYSNIENLLLNNQAWLGNNRGTFEKLSGNFGLVTKVSGFSTVNGTAIGFDVSADPTVPSGVMLSTVFSGTSLTYVKRYTAGSYADYNFTKNWTINCPGIPLESDNNAGGNLYYNGNLTTGFTQTITNNTAIKLTGNTTSVNTTTANSLFRFVSPSNNKLQYDGLKKRDVQISASLSVRGNTAGEFFAFLIAKNGTVVTESNAIVRIDNSNDIQNVSLNALISMIPGDFLEVYTQRLLGSNTTSLTIFSENLSLN